MKKRIVSLILAALAAVPALGQEAQDYWKEKVVETTLGQPFVSFQVERELYIRYQGVTEFDQAYEPWRFWAMPGAALMDDGWHRTLMTADSLFLCYYQEGNYSYGRLTNLSTEYEINNFYSLAPNLFRGMDGLLGFYLNPGAEALFQRDFFRIEPTDDGRGHRLSYATQRQWMDQEGNWRPQDDTVTYFVDDATGRIYLVEVVEDMHDGGAFINRYRITHLSFERPELDLALFRKSKQTDPSFSYYSLNTPGEQNPSEGVVYVPNEDIDRLLDAPLLGADGHEATLRSMEGWVLVDIWTFGCKPCVRFAMGLDAERDSLGYRILERAGVTLVCVNPKSERTQSLVDYAVAHHAADITYAGKSLLGALNWTSTPYYLLLSPQKQIVFRGSDLGENYEKILKIVR